MKKKFGQNQHLGEVKLFILTSLKVKKTAELEYKAIFKIKQHSFK